MGLDRTRVKDLFFDATELPPDQRDAFLVAATRGEPELHEAVRRLLAHHDDAPLIADPDIAPPESDPDPLGLVGVSFGDRYAIERYVAEGGFAFVYRALDTIDRSSVAMKILKEVDDDERERVEAAFRREGELLERLARDEPTFVRVLSVGRSPGPRGLTLLYLVLEWLDGAVLEVPPAGLPLAQICRKLAPVARALAAAHDAGVAHRDVKPGNLFETRDGTVRLLDLGIAKVAEDRRGGFASTASAHSAFTTRYAAPEQLLNQPTGPWTDVYALAMVCLELLAGRHPYAELGVLEALLAIPDPQRRPGPRAMGLEVSADVERAFASALSTRPAERPDMRSLWEALTRAAAG